MYLIHSCLCYPEPLCCSRGASEGMQPCAALKEAARRALFTAFCAVPSLTTPLAALNPCSSSQIPPA